MPAATRTLGIDLASQPKDTAACAIEWSAPTPRVLPPDDIADADATLSDSVLVDLLRRQDFAKAAIDAPFGWPLEFVEGVVLWRDGQEWPLPPDSAQDQQRRFWLRETDREVLRATGLPLQSEGAMRRGKRPLSVTTSWLAFAALRCARILAEVGRRDAEPVDRSGEGRIVEVYPDAALREWGVWPHEWDSQRFGYKGDEDKHRQRRNELVQRLAAKAGAWLTAEPRFVDAWVESDDDLDALISALVARTVQQGNSQPIKDEERAKLEGWIRLPTSDSLERVAD